MIHVCTSFSPHQYGVYGKRFIDSFLTHWPGDCPLHVFHEGGFESPAGNVLPHDLRADGELNDFLGKWADKRFANGVMPDGRVNYRFQAVKFARKVFAYTGPPKLDKDDWWVWLDADVEFHAPVSEDWLGAVCPGGFMASYIGRTDWDHSEAGFLGFSMRYHGAEILKDIREIYTSGLLFGLEQWHDSYVFDVVRKKWEAQGHLFFNLADGIGGMHPWPETRLGEVCSHRKGPQAKRETYGAVA